MKKLTAFLVLWGLSVTAFGEPTISVQTADEDIRVVLDAVAEQSGYNIVIPEGVKMQVRVRLRDVTLKQALDSILVGEKFPILQSTITDEGTVTETFDRYEPIGVQLRVIPHILANDEVELLIEPQVTSLGSLVTGSTGLTTPRISARRVESRVRVGDGQSVVIAGLVTEREDVTVTRVPFLSRVPYLGELFTHRSTTKDKADLVVVLTPYIDRTEADLDREIEGSGLSGQARRVWPSMVRETPGADGSE